MRTKGPKIVVIGAGSASFGLTNLGAIMRTKGLHGATLSLCDIKSEGLLQIKALASRINNEWNCGMTIESSTNYEELLPGANFVIVSTAIDREKCWQMDYDLGKRHGIHHYAENGGPGGFFHTARNLAVLMPIFHNIKRLAPDSLTLNFTNPMTRICTAAANYAGIKIVGICHQLNFGYAMAGRILGKKLGLDIDHDYTFVWHDKTKEIISAAAKDRLDIFAAGINHYTWFRSIRDKQTGEELLPLFKKLFVEQTSFEPYSRAITEIFGETPTSGDCHCLEYMPYTSNMVTNTWDRFKIQMYPLQNQINKRDTRWHDISAMSKGEMPIDSLLETHTERAEQMMDAIWNGTHGYDMAVNVLNTDGLITNMAKDAIVEVPAMLGLDGVKGIAAGELPPIVADLCNRQKLIVDLCVKSIIEGDRGLALQALAIDPMIDNLDIARAILAEGLELNKKYLPMYF